MRKRWTYIFAISNARHIFIFKLSSRLIFLFPEGLIFNILYSVDLLVMHSLRFYLYETVFAFIFERSLSQNRIKMDRFSFLSVL